MTLNFCSSCLHLPGDWAATPALPPWNSYSERNSYFWTCTLWWQSSGTVKPSVRKRRHTQCAFSPLLPSASSSYCLRQEGSQKGNAGLRFAFCSHSVWETIPETCADRINGRFTQLTLIYKLPRRHVQELVSYVILEPVKLIKLMTIVINHN